MVAAGKARAIPAVLSTPEQSLHGLPFQTTAGRHRIPILLIAMQALHVLTINTPPVNVDTARRV